MLYNCFPLFPNRRHGCGLRAPKASLRVRKGSKLTDRSTHRRFQLILLLTFTVLIVSGLQAVTATPLRAMDGCDPVIRTGNCHQPAVQFETTACCPSRACHQATPVARDLGCPEYHNQHKNAHPLVHESRSYTPQFKAGQAVVAAYPPPVPTYARPAAPQKPLQSLASLKSVVLLH